MLKLRQIVEENDTPYGFVFDISIQVLIVVSLACFSLETLPDLPNQLASFLSLVRQVIVIVFVLEYILRVVVAEDKAKFVFSFFGIVDLLAILPFFLELLSNVVFSGTELGGVLHDSVGEFDSLNEWDDLLVAS